MSGRVEFSYSQRFRRIVLLIISAILFLLVADILVRLVFGFIFFTLLFAYLYSNRLQKKLHAKYLVSTIRVPAGTPFYADLIVENKGLLPAFSFCITCQKYALAHPSSVDTFIIHLGKKERKKIQCDFFGRERGKYSIGNAIIKCADPFGVFPFTLTLPTAIDVWVYPEKYSLSVDCLFGLPQGKKYTQNKAYEDLTECRSIRDYIPGDEIKRINWRATARFNTLYTNEFDNTLNEPCFIILNLTDSDYELRLRHYTQEKAIKIAAAIVKAIMNNHQLCGFSTTGVLSKIENESIFITPQRGSNLLILDILSSISSASNDRCGLELLKKSVYMCKTGTRVFYIGPGKMKDASKTQKIKQVISMYKKKCMINPFFVEMVNE
ncbi:MAG TPA: DUF58 domain-containing protein [Treponemataceae bacterium]|nr:DUF58 domain-containing protein [Treponemataceae bacterium]